MAEQTQDIRGEILTQCRLGIASRGLPPDTLTRVEDELNVFASIEDIHGRGTCLNKLYFIWKNNLGRTGHINKINSWTAAALGLTDRLPEGPFFPIRRCFARAGFPDVDSDFDDERREEIVQHIKDQYGFECVANVGTYGTLHAKSAIRSVIKPLDVAGAYYKGKDEWKTANKLKADEIISAIPKPQGAKTIFTDDNGVPHDIKTVQDAYDHIPAFRSYMDEYPAVMKHASQIEGIASQFSTHASGIIVADAPLAGLAPVRPVSKKNWRGDVVESVSTQFAYEDCETIGLIKFDVLAIKTLSIIKHAVWLIKENFDRDIDVENVPLDDKNTYRLYRSGNLVGVFQCEKYGMQKTCRDMQVSTFDDVMAAIALYRPGPMASIPKYVARKEGREPVDYFHPTIEKHVRPYLERTYGLLVFQEQVMQICNALAGFTITDGYVIIKSIGKKQLDLMIKFGGQFVDGCVQNGVPREVAQQYWDKFIVPFADYGFNASHSCCYGYNSVLTAYLKANFPEEYMVASLNVEAERKKWDKVVTLERDCREKCGIDILPRCESSGQPGINTCNLRYEIVEHAVPGKRRGKLRPSILCQGLSSAAAEEIVRKRPTGGYQNIRDFASRTGRCVDTSSVAALVDAGFFKRNTGKKVLEEFEAVRADLKKTNKKGVPSGDMFAEMDQLES
jgi:DNA polymerase-3 subunit alpha